MYNTTMQEPAPTGLKVTNLVDQDQKSVEQKIANFSTQAGHSVNAKDVSAKVGFPTDLIERIGGEVVDKIHDVDENIKEMTQGSTYIRTTKSNRPISIASFREKLRLFRKKAA